MNINFLNKKTNKKEINSFAIKFIKINIYKLIENSINMNSIRMISFIVVEI